MAEPRYILGGFEFNSAAEYHEAQKEAESIEFIKARTDLTNMKTVLKLYNSLLDKESFHTVIGYVFLTGMRNNLLRSKITAPDEIRAIPIKQKQKDKVTTAEELVKEKVVMENNEIKDQLGAYRQRVKNLGIVIAFLVVIIIGIFIVALRSDNSAIGNYEEKILNKYSEWEEDLNAREKELQAREDALTK